VSRADNLDHRFIQLTVCIDTLKTPNAAVLSPGKNKRKRFQQPQSAGLVGNATNSSSQAEPAAHFVFRKPATQDENDDFEALSSSLPSSPPPEVEEVHMDDPGGDSASASVCPLCGDAIDESFREEFEIEQCGGKRMNLKMQERFCQAHKTRYAKTAWQDRSYPEVDWESLHARLKEHHAHIQGVLDGHVRSYYRDDLEEKIRNGKTRTALQSLKSKTASGVRVGYYGARGGKIM